MVLNIPHKVFLITEILEMILVQTDMQTLLISAQRVCHRWHDVIQDSADLQAALFFKPVRYKLPRGILGIRNPLLDKFLWPWFCSKQAQSWGAPNIREIKIPPADPQDNDRFLRKEANWTRMLFQQPPRSCIGLVEKDGGVIHGSAYTEVKVRNGDYLRIGDLVTFDSRHSVFIHPLPEEGLIWWGNFFTHQVDLDDLDDLDFWELKELRDGVLSHSRIHRSQVAYAASTYRRDCDIVIFTHHCDLARRKRHWPLFDDRICVIDLYSWLRDLGMTLVPDHISIPMPSN